MELNIKEYIAPILKWWWLLLLTTVVAAGSSYFATRDQEEVFRTSTTLLVGAGYDDPSPSNASLNIGITLTKFYVNIANRSEVREATKEALGLNQLPRQIFVRQVNETFIEISVTDTVPERAQAVANELARQLILRTPAAENDNQFVADLLIDYESQISDMETQIEQKRQQVAAAVGAREISELQIELNNLEMTRTQLIRDYNELRRTSSEEAVNTIQVIEEARLPINPIVSSNTVQVITAAAIGLVLATTAAYGLEFLDDTVKTPEMITKLTGYSTLAGIDEIRSDNKLVTISRPRSPTSEAFRVLRTAIQFAIAGTESRKVLLLSSAVPEEGKSTMSANLAAVLAQAGNRVLLVDADLRRPSQHKVFGIQNKEGLSNLLLDLSNKPDADREGLIAKRVLGTPQEGLELMTCGPIPPNPSELLGSAQMKAFLEAATAVYDFVLLDSPPVLSVTDATLLSALADGMILVVRADKSRKQYVKQTADRLKEANANILGYVLNALSPKSQGRSAYYYYKDPYLAAEEIETVGPVGAATGIPDHEVKDTVGGGVVPG